MNTKPFLTVLLCLAASCGTCQLLINGEAGNIIYSRVTNTITYTEAEDCRGYTVEIDGVQQTVDFSNCSFEISYLRRDSSELAIYQTNGQLLFTTILLRNHNAPTARLLIGDSFRTEGPISKADLGRLRAVQVHYPCPWLSPALVSQYTLIAVQENGEYLDIVVQGSAVPERVRRALVAMNRPVKLYIEDIRWRPASCPENLGSLVFDIVE